MKYFEEQVYPPHVDYFDYDHMNNIIKLVKSSSNDINEKGENGQSDLLQFLSSPITIDEIQKAIRKLKCKKAAGIDGIPAEFYKHGCNELLPALVVLFNTIIANGDYPSSWATGIIHPSIRPPGVRLLIVTFKDFGIFFYYGFSVFCQFIHFFQIEGGHLVFCHFSNNIRFLLNIALILLDVHYFDVESSEKIICYRQNAQNSYFLENRWRPFCILSFFI